MNRRFAFAILASTLFSAVLCNAQIVVRDHATSAVVTTPLLLPDAPVNDFEERLVDIQNSGASDVAIHRAVATGLYFSLCCESAFVLKPGESRSLTLRFAPLDAGYFSGSLAIDDLTIFLFGRSIAAASLYVQPPSGLIQAHSGMPLDLTLDPTFSGTLPCLLRNDSKAPVTVRTLSASGGWILASAPALSLVLQPGEQAPFSLKRAVPASQVDFSGVVRVDQWTYAIGAHPPEPAFHLQISNTLLGSGQQASLAIVFDSPPFRAVSGTVELTLQTSGQSALTDPAILFLPTGTAQADFSSVPGQTAATFAGAPSIAFQTGTTAGILKFQAAWSHSADQASVPLSPSPVVIESVSAARGSNALDVTVTGFDNTRTSGRLSFSFFDSAGAFIGNPVTADFTAAFADFFFQKAYDAGGMFKMAAHFPVTGDPGKISAVQVDLLNSSGDAQSGVTPFK